MDEICFYHGLGAETDHPTALYHMNTGNRFGGDPAIGAWVTYGLGTVNQNLPAFVVLPEVIYPKVGRRTGGTDFCRPIFRGRRCGRPDRRS